MTAEAENIRLTVVRPVLELLDPEIPYSRVAENLVLGTLAHESEGFKYRYQVEPHGLKGPARGLGMQEKPTVEDICNRWLQRPGNAKLESKVASLLVPGTAPYDQLETNDRLSVALCRIKYWMCPGKLPADPNDVFEMARLWAAHYNSAKPASIWVANYRRCIENVPDQLNLPLQP